MTHQFHYVIVGAGSAGCVLANRPSEDPDVSVLLLEPGPPDTADLIHIPAAFAAGANRVQGGTMRHDLGRNGDIVHLTIEKDYQ